jgi:ABC-type transporter Mla subunit MlaD
VSASPFDEITKKIDKHFDKTGVVLVGMHQELQEQRHRIGQYHEKVDAVTSDLNRRSDDIVSDLRTRAEASLSVLNEVDPLVRRLRAVAQEADHAIRGAGEVIQVSTNNLSQSHTEFRAETEKLVGSIKDQIAAFSLETGELLKQVSHQQMQSITASSKETRVALLAIVAEQKGLLAGTQKVFGESVVNLEVKLSAHMDAHKAFLKFSHDEHSKRQRVSDAAFADLRAEIERHQLQRLALAKNTRVLVGVLVTIVGFALLGALVYGAKAVL